MIVQKLPLHFAKFAVTLFLGLFASLFYTQQLQAKPLQASERQDLPVSDYLNREFHPPKRGSPVTTSAGGSRGCIIGEESPAVALIPADHLALTTKADPMLLWYISQDAVQSARTLIFKIKDRDDSRTLYKTTIPLPTRAGIVSLSLDVAPEASLLRAGEMYHWYLIMDCDPKDPSANIFIDGWFERVDPASIPVNPGSTLAAALEGASLPERFSLYARTGIWHDALETLVELRRAQPNNAVVRAGWNQLLASVGLGQLSAAPLLDPPTSPPKTQADR